MFRLMFGLNPCLDDQQMDTLAGETGADYMRFRKPGDDLDEIAWAVTLVHAEHLANVAVQASYHGCLPAIACQIVSDFNAN